MNCHTCTDQWARHSASRHREYLFEKETNTRLCILCSRRWYEVGAVPISEQKVSLWTMVALSGRFLCSRISPVENGPFRLNVLFHWSLLVLLIVNRVDFKFFVLFIEEVNVREYCCTEVETGWQLCALRFLGEQRLGEPSSQRVGGFGLSRKPPTLRSWSCTQPRGVTLQQPQPLSAAWDLDCALLPSCDAHCWRAELGLRHADLLREATAEIGTPASAPCMILQCGSWYGCVAVWLCGCAFGGGMSDAIVSNNTCKTFSTEFFYWIQSKKSSFSTGSASRNCQSKNVESKKAFFRLRKKARIWASVKATA